MANEKEEREFQLEKLRVQIEHRDAWSALTKRETTFVAIGFSLMMSFLILFFGFFVKTLNVNWLYASIGVIPMFFAVMVVLVWWYGRKYEEIRENLHEELKNLREKFIDNKPVEKPRKRGKHKKPT